MSGELKIVTDKGETFWFGRDDHFPAEVRVYTGDTRYWEYMPTSQARQIVYDSLDRGASIEQGDPALFFRQEPEQAAG